MGRHLAAAFRGYRAAPEHVVEEGLDVVGSFGPAEGHHQHGIDVDTALHDPSLRAALGDQRWIQTCRLWTPQLVHCAPVGSQMSRRWPWMAPPVS